MTRRPLDRQPVEKPWWQANTAAWVALLLTIGAGWKADNVSDGADRARAEMMERRLAAMERRCSDQ